MINKQDFINKSTSLYDSDAIGDIIPAQPSGNGLTPAEYLAKGEERFIPEEVKVAGLGRAVRGIVNAVAPEKFKITKSVREIREGQMQEQGIPDLTADDISNVLSNEAPTGPFTGAQQGDLAGRTPERNINLDNIQTPDDIKTVIDSMAQYQYGNVTARRGQMSHAETQRIAQEQIKAVELITGWKPATTWNAEQITAARQLMVNVSQNIQMDAKRLMADPSNTSDADWANFAKKQKTFAAIQNAVSGATAESGRTLSALKIPIEGDQRLAAISQLIDQSGKESRADCSTR